MKKYSLNEASINEDTNKLKVKSYISVMVYFLLGVLWILYSDYAVLKLIKDIEVLNWIQSIKGILFVILTSLFFVFTTQRYLNRISKLHLIHKKTVSKVEELQLSNEKNELYHMLTRYLTAEYDSNETVVMDVFRYLMKHSLVCDMGSVLVIEKDKVTFIDAIGYDIDFLNELDLKVEQIELYSVGIRNNKVAEKSIERKIGLEKYNVYKRKNPEIYESMYIGFMDSEDKKIGISLDISKANFEKHRMTFTNQTINEMKELQFLITSLFKMKTLVDLKHILQMDVVSSFIAALEFHDNYTKGHSEEVAKISTKIGKEMELNPDELDALHWAAMIHDIGKVVISKEILNKIEPLTKDEYKLIQQHPINGQMFLSKSESLRQIGYYVRTHHERYDGKGYPDGLVGEEIPLIARIICVADSYHAMTSNRPYRKGLSKQEALQEMINNDGTQFCPNVVEAFLRMSEKLH